MWKRIVNCKHVRTSFAYLRIHNITDFNDIVKTEFTNFDLKK